MIDLRGVSIRSGGFALCEVSLSIRAGTCAVLMGGTGQGKTTILEAICGLRTIMAGTISLDGEDVTRRKPADRGVGYVPQDLGLFPTMTVRGHLEFALRVRRRPTQEINGRVEQLAHLLGIEHLLSRRPQGLSGGEGQRVALGRALSFQPQILLLDEPFNALDEVTRDRLCELLKSIQKKTRLTTLHVTHSRAEARALADCLLVIANGRVEERPLSELETLGSDLDPPPGSPVVDRHAQSSRSQSSR